MSQHPDNIVRDNKGKTPRYVLEQNKNGVWLLRDQVYRKCLKTWSYKPSEDELRKSFSKKRVVITDDLGF